MERRRRKEKFELGKAKANTLTDEINALKSKRPRLAQDLPAAKKKPDVIIIINRNLPEKASTNSTPALPSFGTIPDKAKQRQNYTLLAASNSRIFLDQSLIYKLKNNAKSTYKIEFYYRILRKEDFLSI